MKRLLIVPSWARQTKRNKPQRFKQLPTSWWSVLRAYLKKLRQAARKSSASCQTAGNHSPHQSAPIKTLHQKVCPKQQLWQRLKGPSTDNNSTLTSNITSSCSQPSVNFSLRLSPAAPADPHSFAHRGLSALSINHLSLKVSGISQLIDMNSLLKYASLKPLPLIIHTSTPTLSISPLPESQRNQKKAALVYLPKQINHLPPLPPIIVVNKPPQPLNPDWQWLANKPQAIDPAVEMINPSPKEPTVTKTQSEKPIQKKSQSITCKTQYLLKPLKIIQESRKRCRPYFDSELTEPPKKRARLESNSPLGEAGTSLIESENTVTETKSEKAPREKSQNKSFEIDYFFNVSKKCQASTKFQKSRKSSDSYSGSELLEPPKKHAKLAYNLYPDKTETLLNEPENKIIFPSFEMTNPSPKGPTVKETEPEKPTPKESQNTTLKRRLFFCQRFPTSQKSRKRCHPDSDLELTETPKNPATLASISNPNEIETPLIESKNKDEQSIKYDDYRVETTTEKTDSSTDKWSGSELSNSESSETETAIESDWCYLLAAYGYDPQRYPLLTQLPDDCHWGKRILRDFKPEYTFWLDNEEKSMLWGVRHYPVLAEFFQIDPLTYQHPYLEQAINAYTAPTESPSCSANPVNTATQHCGTPKTYQSHRLPVY